MAVSIIPNEYRYIDVTLTIPRNATLPITYSVPGITNDFNIICKDINYPYIFTNLTAQIENNEITLNGTRLNPNVYNDAVTIHLILSKILSISSIIDNS